MKRTLMMTTAMIFAAGTAFAAIDPQQLADSYVAEGYSYVEVKQGPTQTKIEAVKGTSVVEAVYDNETGEIISQETQAADAEDLARSGVEVRTTDRDFEDTDDENDDDQSTEDDDEDDDNDGDEDGDDGDDGNDGDDGDDGDDDHGGDDGDSGGEGEGGDGGHDGGSGGNDSSSGDCD